MVLSTPLAVSPAPALHPRAHCDCAIQWVDELTLPPVYDSDLDTGCHIRQVQVGWMQAVSGGNGQHPETEVTFCTPLPCPILKFPSGDS